MLDVETIKILAKDFDFEPVEPTKKGLQIIDESTLLDIEQMQDRLPVVVVLGHVDHGKTTLLDYIRKTRVASKEKGGITQHLGAYEVHTDFGDFITIDTPGHEAFPKIRKRGAQIADIAILIVAADDGVMPQTVESIKLLQETKTPIVVAINKVDKVDPSRIEVVKRELAQHNVLPEDWGGDVICAPISATVGTGVDELLEMVVLQAQLLELKSSEKGAGRGHIIESHVEKGRGVVGTLILRQGMVEKGDHFICGSVAGRVTTIINSFGKKLHSVGPSVPVQIAGFDAIPDAGSYFEVVSQHEYKKFISSGAMKGVGAQRLQTRAVTDNEVYPLILKADTHSSQEALIDAIEKLAAKLNVRVSIVHAGVGEITESDVEFAYNTGAQILSLHAKTSHRARSLAKKRNVDINSFDIIYKLLEFWQEEVEKLRKKEVTLRSIGKATVLKVFNIKGIGTIAGCRVDSGYFVSDGIVSVTRDGEFVGKGKIQSLQREKQSVKDVRTGFECGILVENMTNFKPDDIIECFVEEEK